MGETGSLVTRHRLKSAGHKYEELYLCITFTSRVKEDMENTNYAEGAIIFRIKEKL
jgi:hypothetical protein